MVQKWLQAGCREQHGLSPTATGVPQGGMAAPVLANLALDGLETRLKAHYPPKTKRAQRAQGTLVRSGDDVIRTGSASDLLDHAGKPLVTPVLGDRGLERSPTKTHRTSLEDGCACLGQPLRQDAGKRLLKPARKKVPTCRGHVRDMVQAQKPTTAGHLSAPRNPMIRGWAHYHRHVVSKVVCNTGDTAIFKSLGAWATRRHPKQSRRWVAKQSFRTHQGRPWTCVGTYAHHQGPPQALALLRAGEVPMQRQGTIKGAANPDDPQGEADFEARLGVQMTQTLKGRRPRLYLWKHQHGLCPVCRQKMTRLTGWHHPQSVWRTHGGRDATENRVLLHPNCHRQNQSPPLDVAPPRSARSVCKA